MRVHAISSALRVLVVDDEAGPRKQTVQQLEAAGCVAAGAENGYWALNEMEAREWDVVLCDHQTRGMKRLELLERIRREHPEVDVILMTAYGTVETAVEAMRAGAADYLTKPFDFRVLEHRLKRISELRHYRREIRALRARLDGEAESLGILGDSPGIRQALGLIRSFAAHDAPVLVTGETGTGKELVARALHQLGPRSQHPFVPVACGAIPTSLAESMLFGHEKGAFTGASAARVGAFERADRGTLLLDDVDDLPFELQAKLLRTLQDGTFMRVGGSGDLHADVRVVATTKVKLVNEVEAGRFRDDLFYRLRALEIHLPPLRERGHDILLLVHHFMRGMSSRDIALSAEVAARLRTYPWPGNVRELRHAMESAMVVCGGDTLELEHLPEFIRNPEAWRSDDLFTVHLDGREHVSMPEAVRELEEQLLTWAMERARGQQKRAAKLLGLPRTTLQSKLSKLSLTPDQAG